MKRVYLNEYNILMGNTTYLPLVSGLLRAFAETREKIVKNFEFMPFLFHIDNPANILSNYDNPSVAAFSVCMWNEQLCLKIAEELKKEWPNCLVVFGGPQVPHHPEDYFKKHWFIDVAVRGEGEEQFANVLERFLICKNFSDLAGVSWRDPTSEKIVRNVEEQPFRRDLDYYPSPYLENFYKDLMAQNPDKKFQAIIETNRGCPFPCSFCYWGKGGLSRKYKFHGLQRTFKELEWCADHKIQYVFNADSNFGMHRRDRLIAEKIVELKTNRGFPEKFRTCYGKNTNERIFEIGVLFHQHDLEKGITLSRQSLNENTLKIIKRDNIKLEVYSDLQRSFNDFDVPVYCEMILGLPGETLNSWVSGLEQLFETGIKNQIFIYLCQIYNNTELANPFYQQENGLILRSIKMEVIHADVGQSDCVQEIEKIVIGTKTMPVEDWHRAARLSWIALLLHSMKIGFHLMGYMRDRFNLRYTDLIQFISNRTTSSETPTMLDNILDNADELLDGIKNGEGHGSYDPAYGEIFWEFEELSFLLLSQDLDRFYVELEQLLQRYLDYHGLSFDEKELFEAITYQKLRIPTSQKAQIKMWDFEFNFPEYFEKRLSNSPVMLDRDPQRLWVEQPDFSDPKDYARKVILWGRKSGLIERQASWKQNSRSSLLIAEK